MGASRAPPFTSPSSASTTAPRQERLLDGEPVDGINANLTAGVDLTQVRRLAENAGIAFMGDAKGGPFDIPEDVAPSDAGEPESGRAQQRRCGAALGERARRHAATAATCGSSTSASTCRIEEAALYEAPFEYVKQHVKPIRSKIRRAVLRRAMVAARRAAAGDARSARRACAASSPRRRSPKHRLFVWLPTGTLADHQLIVFARDDDYFFGVLHSSVHELWARGLGTQLREVESGFRYTPTTTFETFPFPDAATRTARRRSPGRRGRSTSAATAG